MSKSQSEARHAVVVGAGVGGLGSALALSRRGWRVTLVERDATPTPTDPDAAFWWDRRGAPQVRHSHALLARLRNLLRDRYPDVLARLLAAGATEMRFAEMLPETMADRAAQPGDEDLAALACRRTTFEWVLRCVVLEEDHVELRDGVAVAGLRRAAEDHTTIAGVLLDTDQGAETLAADVVVATTGRRSGVVRWLDDLGIQADVTEEDTGIIYLSRFYRLRPGVTPPPQEGPIGADLGYLKYAIFQGDNRTYSITFAVRVGDDEMRSRLLDPDRFDAAAGALPATAPWVDPDLAEPLTEVHVMGGLLNRRIAFTDASGDPIAPGLLAVGDAHTCTNPLYGRGCSLAMVQAELAADALERHPEDPVAAGRAYEEASAREIEPWYHASLAQDRMARKAAEAERARARAGEGEEAEVDPEAEQAATMADVMREGLLPAVRMDPVVFRAFIRAFNLLATPDALMGDTEVMARVMAVYADKENRPPEPVLGPPRHEMLATLA